MGRAKARRKVYRYSAEFKVKAVKLVGDFGHRRRGRGRS